MHMNSILIFASLFYIMGVDLGGDGGDISPPLFGLGGMINVIIPPTFSIKKVHRVENSEYFDHTTLN